MTMMEKTEFTSSDKSIGSYRWSRQSCDSCHDSGHYYYKDRQTFKEKEQRLRILILLFKPAIFRTG